MRFVFTAALVSRYITLAHFSYILPQLITVIS
jgi:hypothetical protein